MPHKSTDLKIAAVKLYLKGTKTQTEICSIFDCSRRSLMRWVEKYQNENTVSRKSKDNKRYKVKNEHIKFILKTIKKNKQITIQDLLDCLLAKFTNLSLSRVHLRQIIIDNNISLKLKHHRHEPTKRFSKPVEIKKLLKQFYTEISKYKLQDIICIDETSISGFMKRNFCYEKVGKRCVVKTENNAVFRKYTVIFAINTKGVIGYEIYQKGGINAERLKIFLDNKVLKRRKNKLIIMDNASSHRSPIIKETVLKKNHLLYSVPYQHFTNAIENFFSVLKSKLKKIDNLTYDNLEQHIQNTLSDIPRKHYKNIISGAYSSRN